MSDRHEAERPFGFWTAVALVVGGVIGAGIYVMPGQLAGYGWSGLAAWVIGGGAAVLIATVIAAVTEAKPEEPGLMAVLGEVLGPVHGALVGWSCWVGYCCGNAYIALTAARYMSQFVPALAGSTAQVLLACGLIAALAWLNLSGLKGAGRFQVATSALKLLPMLGVLALVAGLALSRPERLVAGAAALPPLVGGSLFEATALAFVAIIGFESAAIAAQRIRRPRRNIPVATMFGVLVCCTAYVFVCGGILLAMPAGELAASPAPVALFVGRYWGTAGADLVAAFAVISAVGCLNVWVMMQSEVPLALVRARLLPGWFGRTNRKDIAWAPLLLGTALSIALLLAELLRQGDALMGFMLRLTSVTGIIVYAYAAAAALRLGLKRWQAVVSLAFCAGLLWGAGLEATLLSLALLLSALPFYWAATRAGPALTSAAAS